MNDVIKYMAAGAAGYVALKCTESLLANIVDAMGTVIGAASEFYVFDGQKERGIEADCDCGQGMPAIGFEVPSEQIEYEEEEVEEDKMRMGFHD